MRSKIIKIIGILFVILILLIAAISVFTRTDYFRNTIKSVVEKAVSRATQQTFTIGKIEGDLIRGLRLKDISFKIEGEPFIHIEELSTEYSLPLLIDRSTLFSRVVPLKFVSVSGANINLIRDKDGNWNVKKLGKEKSEKDKESKKEPPKWNIFIENFLLKDIKITVEDRKKGEVTKINIPELDSSLKMFGITKKIDLNLRNGDLYASKPELNIKGLSTKVIYTRNEAQINDLEANINGAKVKLDTEVNDFKEPKFKFNAAAYGFKIEKGVLNVEVEGEGQYKSPENMQADIEIKLPDSQIMGKKISGSIEKIKMAGTNVELQNGVVKSAFGETSFSGNAKLDRILRKNGVNEFDFKVSLKNINLSDIPDLIKNQPDIGIVNSNFDINGKWKDIKDLEVKVNINEYKQKGNLGEINLKGLVEATKSNVEFDLISNLNKVNLSPILKDKKYTSNLNSNLQLKGSVPLSRDLLDNLTATVQGKILPSSFSDINLTGGEINASYTEQMLNIKSLYLTSDAFKLKAKGTRGEEKGMDFMYEIEVKNLNFISKFLPELDLKGSLKAAGRVQGKIKSPQATLSATVSDFGYKKDLQVKSINLNGETMGSLENPQFQVKGNLKEIEFQERKVKSVDLQARSQDKGLIGKFSILEDAQRSYEIALRLADIKSQEKNLELQKIKLNLEDVALENKNLINITISPNRLIVKSFNLYHKNSFILADANVVFNGIIKAALELKNVNLTDISEILELEPPIQGIASGNISLQGTLENPKIEAKLTAANLQFREFESDKANLNLSYLGKKLSLNLVATEDAREILAASGRVNVDFNFKRIGESLKDATFDLTIKSSNVDLSLLAKLNEKIKEIKGIASGNISLQGTLENPQIEAKLTAINLQFREFKSDRTDLNLSYLGKKLNLNLGVTENAREILSASGRVNVDLNLKNIRENLKDASFDVALKSSGIDPGLLANLNKEIKEIHGKIIADLRAYGSVKSPNINGELKLQDVSLRINSLRDEIKVTTGLVEMRGEKGFIKTLEIKADGGRGTFEGDFDLRELSYNLNGKMDNLQIKPKGITAKLDGDVEVKGSDEKVHVSGKVKVGKARIKIPEEPTKEVEDIKFVDEEKEEEFVIKEVKETGYFRDNVGMDLRVSIPGNAWVKGRGANIEIKGEIGVNKEYGEPLIITGNINTVRGTYEFLGKLFRIEEGGTVTFQGTPQINPFLNVRALYKVSDVNIFVNVSGTVKKPNIQLTSDPLMEQTDIISYLVFGTSSNKIGAGQRASLQQKTAEVLGLMAAGQLKDIVGEKLALDVISIRGGESGPEVEIGKYLTDKLYIAFERATTTQQTTTTAPSTANMVRVEYSLFDFLKLQSNIGGEQAGGDAFFSFDYSCPLLE